MTPAADIDMSTADMKANRREAEMKEVLEPAEPNDWKIHVEGSLPTLAEASGDPTISQIETLLRERKAQHFYGEGKVLTEANKARVKAIDDRAPSNTSIRNMEKSRGEAWESNSKDIIPKSDSVKLTKPAEWVASELADPRIQENDAIVAMLQDFQKRLYVGGDVGGALKTDPAAVWGIHDQLQTQLAKGKDPLQQSSNEAFAVKQTLAAKRLVDEAMNVASRGRFEIAMKDYAERSQEINAANLMREIRKDMVNMHGQLMADKFYRTVRDLAEDRGDPGIDPSMDITDADMRVMLDVVKDLKRAGQIKVGAPRGSQTNLMGALAELHRQEGGGKDRRRHPGRRFLRQGTQRRVDRSSLRATDPEASGAARGRIYPPRRRTLTYGDHVIRVRLRRAGPA